LVGRAVVGRELNLAVEHLEQSVISAQGNVGASGAACESYFSHDLTLSSEDGD
jgi:hypothetical protein